MLYYIHKESWSVYTEHEVFRLVSSGGSDVTDFIPIYRGYKMSQNKKVTGIQPFEF